MLLMKSFVGKLNTSNLKIIYTIIILILLLTLFLISIKPLLNTTSELAPATNTSFTKTFYPHIAVIVEFRALDHIIAVVFNVNRHIPPSWPIQIFHGKENEDFIRNSTLAPFIETGKILLTLLNKTIDRTGINSLLTNASFWQRVRGEKILFFQIDSIMCSNARHKITDFLQYDYVGAPWDTSWFYHDSRYLVGNGGFSLRTRSKILALLALIKYDENLPEDVWYAQNMQEVRGLIPPVSIAKTFAVESVYYDRPVGVHRFGTTCEFRANLSITCPESMIIIPIPNIC